MLKYLGKFSRRAPLALPLGPLTSCGVITLWQLTGERSLQNKEKIFILHHLCHFVTNPTKCLHSSHLWEKTLDFKCGAVGKSVQPVLLRVKTPIPFWVFILMWCQIVLIYKYLCSLSFVISDSKIIQIIWQQNVAQLRNGGGGASSHRRNFPEKPVWYQPGWSNITTKYPPPPRIESSPWSQASDTHECPL